jgi:predicted RNA-binding Zn-ribbon protein involved in translation (DUF1610 family)
MRRLTVEEQIRKDQSVIKNVTPPVCALCGTPLELDEESGEYRCPVCDNEEGQ